MNEVQFAYNSFGQLVADYQEHGGAVNTSTSPKVEYQYTDGSAGHNRPTKMIYPNGRILRYDYRSGTENAINRISLLADEKDGAYQLRTLDRGDLAADKQSVSSKNFAEDWSLDMTGNWCRYQKDDDGNGSWDLDQARDHNQANEISQIAGSSSHVAHDRCGNMTKVPKPDDWNAHFDLTYDAWNRLVKVMDGETTVAEYAHDGRNYWVIKKSAESSGSSSSSSSSSPAPLVPRHYYYSNNWQVLEERLQIPNPQSLIPATQFVWGLRYIDELILRDRNADGTANTGHLGKLYSGLEERLYALQDANWNVTALSDSSANILERYAYSAYGTPIYLTPAFAARASSSYDWETVFAGYRWDGETQASQVRHRYLYPALGRFAAHDPIGYIDGHSLYAMYFVLNKTDPFGSSANTPNYDIKVVWVHPAAPPPDWDFMVDCPIPRRDPTNQPIVCTEAYIARTSDPSSKPCTDVVNAAIASNPVVLDLYKRIAKRKCPPPRPACACFKGPCSSFGGFYFPFPRNTLYINIDNMQVFYVDTLQHELTHYLYGCRGKRKPPDCLTALKEEMAANYMMLSDGFGSGAFLANTPVGYDMVSAFRWSIVSAFGRGYCKETHATSTRLSEYFEILKEEWQNGFPGSLIRE